jgi:hypothetical protein
MSKEITRLTFTRPHNLQDALGILMNDAVQLGHARSTVEFAPGVAMLVEDTLTDGSKVARIVIAQVEA